MERSLPFALRHPTLARAMGPGVVAAAILVAAVLLAAARLRPPQPEATLLLAANDGTGGAAVSRLDVGGFDWNDRKPMLAAARAGQHWATQLGPRDVLRPGTNERAVQQAYPGGKGMDVALVTPTGTPRRLTGGGGDNIPMSFSPDGRFLLLGTSRWRTDVNRDLAVLDVRSGALRRLTAAPDSDDREGIWSPDGSRIAFIRVSPSRQQWLACWTTVDAQVTRCPARLAVASMTMVGWLDANRVVACDVSGPEAPSHHCEVIDWSAESAMPLPGSLGIAASVDPSGNFVLWRRDRSSGGASWSVSPVDLWSQSRPLMGDSSRPVVVQWASVNANVRLIAAMSFTDQRPRVMKGVPYLLRVRATDPAGLPVAIGTVQWTSLAPRVARVDSNGVLIAADTGTAIVQASAGGWATTVDTIAVRPAESHVVLNESWSGNVTGRWRFYGDPLPAVAPDSTAGRVFLNRGDGTFFSGAYYTPLLDARNGLSVDVDLVEPITVDKWQFAQVSLESHRDSAALAAWDHRTGYNLGLAGPSCNWIYPFQEGADARTTAVPVGDLRALPAAAHAAQLGTGRWYHMTMQIFPDGRCGIALNGVPVYLSGAADLAGAAATLELQGSSVGTRIAVGQLRVTSGIREGLDWTRLVYRDGEWRAAPAGPLPH